MWNWLSRLWRWVWPKGETTQSCNEQCRVCVEYKQTAIGFDQIQSYWDFNGEAKVH